jgi:ApaG protein
MYEKQTKDILVCAEPLFLEEHSSPEEYYYVWAYTIKIENKGDQQIQLLNRHWIITDANGHSQEVKGEGVVGEQPVLKPGESYVYTSGAPLSTSSGFMKGSYQMQYDDGSIIDVQIPTFILDNPDLQSNIH